jgi:hypothetical protein
MFGTNYEIYELAVVCCGLSRAFGDVRAEICTNLLCQPRPLDFHSHLRLAKAYLSWWYTTINHH